MSSISAAAMKLSPSATSLVSLPPVSSTKVLHLGLRFSPAPPEPPAPPDPPDPPDPPEPYPSRNRSSTIFTPLQLSQFLDLSSSLSVAASGSLDLIFVSSGDTPFAFRRSFTAVCSFCSDLVPDSVTTRFDSGSLSYFRIRLLLVLMRFQLLHLPFYEVVRLICLDRRSAGMAIMSLDGRHICGQFMMVTGAYASTQKIDTSSQSKCFAGDLTREIIDAALFDSFTGYISCSFARVFWVQKAGCSRGFGSGSLCNQQNAQSVINELNGKFYHITTCGLRALMFLIVNFVIMVLLGIYCTVFSFMELVLKPNFPLVLSGLVGQDSPVLQGFSSRPFVSSAPVAESSVLLAALDVAKNADIVKFGFKSSYQELFLFPTSEGIPSEVHEILFYIGSPLVSFVECYSQFIFRLAI